MNLAIRCLLALSMACPVASAADKENREYVLAGINQSRLKLESGVCQIQGVDEKGRFELTHRFDGVRVRCDLVRKGAGDKGTDETHYFSKDDTVVYSYLSKRNFSGIQIFRASKYLSGYELPYWDLRTVGLGVYRSSLRHSFGKALNDYRGNFQNAKVVRSGDVWKLTATISFEGGARTELESSVDESKDFAVVSTTSQYMYEENSWEKKPEDKVAIDVEWEKVDGVWVPSRESLRKGAQSVYDFTLKWQSANKSFDQSLLHYRTFPLPPDTPVLDVTTGRGRVIDADQSVDPLPRRSGGMPFVTWKTAGWLVGVGLFVIGLVLLGRHRTAGPKTQV